MPKPDLGPVNVGDRLLVIPVQDRRHVPEPIEAVVVKKGRVWIELDRADAEQHPNRTAPYRLRLDTQRDHTGFGHGYSHRFVTREQYAWEQRISAAKEALDDVGLSLTGDSPWREEARLLALAEYVTTYGLPLTPAS